MEVKHHKLKIGILKRLERFHSIDKAGIPAYVPKQVIPPDQVLLGVYENLSDSRTDAVFVTDTSVWVERSGVLSEVRYSDMKSVKSSPENKRSANALTIVKTDGSEQPLKILGKNADGADVFAFQTFLLHAIPR